MTQLRRFQIALAVAACVPFFGGLYEIIKSPGLADPALESHYHYLSGLLMGIGITFWFCARSPENTARFRLLVFIVLIGGLARLFHMLTSGDVSTSIVLSLLMELGVAPAMAYWQHRIVER